MIVTAKRTRVFKELENLFNFVVSHYKTLPEKSILVVTSKIVALAEGRTVMLGSKKDKENLIKSESEFAISTKYVWLTIKDGMIAASAGVDESNANGKIILLPSDSFKSARDLRRKLMNHYNLKKFGVVITDSRIIPLRAGVTGVALGYAGFKGIREYRGKQDIFGRKFHFSRTNLADGLATSAVILMGEGNEQQPLALVEKAPIEFTKYTNSKELYIPIQDDIYKPLFSPLLNRK